MENVFGGFHLAVWGLAGLILIILIIGGVSMLTALWYDSIFLVAMYTGYGAPRAIPALILMAIIIWTLLQWKGYIDRAGGNY